MTRSIDCLLAKMCPYGVAMRVLNGGDGGAGEVFPQQCLLSRPPSAVAVVVISEWSGVNGIHCTVLRPALCCITLSMYSTDAYVIVYCCILCKV